MRGILTEPETVSKVLALADGTRTQQDVAETLGLSNQTISDLLARYAPVAKTFGAIKRDLFTGLWQFAALENIDAMYAQKAAGTLNAGDRRNYVVAAAVASEKALLFAGQPTQIVAGLHEVRVELPALMEKLAQVGQRLRQIGAGTTTGSETAENDAARSGNPTIAPSVSSEEI